MVPKKSRACTLKVGQMEKNPILALSTSEKEVEKYTRVAKSYGNVTPAIVGQRGGAYQVLAGQAGLEACAHSGICEMPAIITEVSGEAEQMKLALLLSTVHEGGGALSEGAFIDALVTQYGVTRHELTRLLKKSKSWISKRQSLILRLSKDVREMVKDGTICARTAEEIAKLPGEVQFTFANNAARDSLSKTDVGELVRLYIREDTDSVMREEILKSPLAVLSASMAAPTATRRREKRGMAERIADNAGFVCRLVYELRCLMAAVDKESLALIEPHLRELQGALVETLAALDMAAVYPGKQGGVAS